MPPATAGTLYFGRVAEDWYKMVFVGKVRVRDSEQTAYLMAIPAEGDGPRDRRVPLTGGDGEPHPSHGHARLIAVRSLKGYRFEAPSRVGVVRDWGPELAPRLDALQELMVDEQSHPMDPIRPAEFVFSDNDPDTGTQERARGRLELIESSPELPSIREERAFRPPPRLERGGSDMFGQGPLGPEETRALLEQVRRALPPAPPGRGGRSAAAGARRSGAERSGREATAGAGASDESASQGSAPSSDRGRKSERGRDRDRRRRHRRRRSSSSSSESRSSSSGRRRGRGARKIRSYERCRGRFERRPERRWEYLERAATEAGYPHASNKVELLVTECTKLGKAKGTCYLAAMIARTGAAAAAGQSKLASGLAAATLGYLDTLYVLGDAEVAWRTTLTADPVVIQRTPTMPKAMQVPETGAKKESGGGFSHRLKFSQLIEPEILESTLEAGKQWQAWDALTRGSA